MKDKKSLRKKIMEDPDFIYCPRLGNSVTKLLDKHPDGIDEERLEKVLLMPGKEIDLYYQSALDKLRKIVDDDVV